MGSGTPTETRIGSEWEKAKRDERAYAVSTGNVDVSANGGTVNLHLKNPTSNHTIHVEAIHAPNQFEASWAIYGGFSSAPSGGSDATHSNLLMDEGGGTPDTGDMTSNVDVTFTADGTHVKHPISGGGSSGNPVGGDISNGYDPIIEPGREVVFELTNTSGSEQSGGIVVAYYTRDDVPSSEQ